MLVLLDETVQQVRIPTAKALSDSAVFRLHPVHEVAGGRVHVSGYTTQEGKKMQPKKQKTAVGITNLFSSTWDRLNSHCKGSHRRCAAKWRGHRARNRCS